MNKQLLLLCHFLYTHLFKPIFFLFDPEFIHDLIAGFCGKIGEFSLFRNVLGKIISYQNPLLSQEINGMTFKNPVGLAAGLDYKAKFINFVPSLGFGYGTVGTITTSAFEGNPKPRLGRLVKSKSLMVNKGFKNEGIKVILKRLLNKNNQIPIGLSLGQTNSKKITSKKAAIEDIVNAFALANKSKACFSYFELNISCPNLFSKISFTEPDSLDSLLRELGKIHLKKPIFIKMPIDKTDKETLDLLETIVKHSVKGVIIGNLQKDRKIESFDKEEINKFKVGNFSGKPTEERSNELIKLTYKKYHQDLIIVGCGGIFTPEDAYKKMRLGASLVQLVTGLIFEGPCLASEINLGLVDLIKRHGFKNIKDVIGADVN